MERLNREFFDEYTRLDNLCRQMFNTDRGVTEYINAMESTSYVKSRNIPDWDSDLKMLKQYRHIRNNLAHTPGEFHREVCVQYDVTWIQLFYGRILKRKDPIALLFKASRAQSSKVSKTSNASTASKTGVKKTSKKKKARRLKKMRASTAFWVAVLFLTLLFIVLLITKG